MPANFHAKGVFNTALAAAQQSFIGDPNVVAVHIDAPLLLLGLMHREVTRCIETEPEDSKVPQYLKDSPLGHKELDQIVALINNVQVPGKK